MTTTFVDDVIAEVVPQIMALVAVDYALLKKGAVSPQASLNAEATFASAAIYASGVDNSYNWPGGDFASYLAPGSYFYVQGFPDGTCDGLAKAASVAAEKVTVTRTLASCAAGSPIGVTVATRHAVKGYITAWEQKHLQTGLVKATELRVMIDPSTLGEALESAGDPPEAQGWTFYQGSEPLTAKSFSVGHVFATFSGANVALLDAALRA